MRCLGVAYNSPGTIVSFLVSTGTLRKGIKILRPGDVLPNATKCPIIIMQDVRQYGRHLRALRRPAYNNTIVIVFGSSLSLSGIKDYLPLDHTMVEGSRCCESVPLKLTRKHLARVLKAQPSPAQSLQPCDHLANMVESVKKDSLLNPLMSYIYTLPSRTHQTPIKELCARALVLRHRFDDLAKSIRKEGLQLSSGSAERLKSIIDGQVADKYRAFFHKFGDGHGYSAIDDLCAEYHVSPYEVRYVLSIVGDAATQARKR